MAAAGTGPRGWSTTAPVLETGATHLWFCDLDAQRDPGLLGSYRELLDADEIQRMQRFVFAHDRHRFLVSHALLRCVLSLYGSEPAAGWRFRKGTHGKPGLVAEQRAPAFNLSHSGSLALLAVGEGAGLLGADIEFHRPVRNFLGLATRNFAPSEAARLPGLEGAALAAEFYDLWTLKEAFVKARGDGLSQSLADFRFTFDRASRRLRFDALAALEPDPGRWAFWSFRLDGPYSAAVALRAADAAVRAEPRCFLAAPCRDWAPAPVECILRASSRITAI